MMIIDDLFVVAFGNRCLVNKWGKKEENIYYYFVGVVILYKIYSLFFIEKI